MPGLNWDHTENIALALYEAHPDVDPLKVRFADLHKWITELDDFGDDPKGSNEGKLEQFRWPGTRSGKRGRNRVCRPGPGPWT